VAEIVRGARQFWHLLVRYTRSGSEGPTEFGLTCLVLFLGLFFVEPFNWWYTFQAAAAYKGLALAAPEQVWGLILIAIAVLSFVGMTSDADGGPSHVFHETTAYVQLFWWLLLTLSILLTNIASTGWVTFGWIGFGQGWVCYRLRCRK
jgi:hypothetical protein